MPKYLYSYAQERVAITSVSWPNLYIGPAPWNAYQVLELAASLQVLKHNGIFLPGVGRA